MLAAVWSLETAVKNQHYILFASVFRQLYLATPAIAGGKVRRGFQLIFIGHNYLL